jgi:hypothetical protein
VLLLEMQIVQGISLPIDIEISKTESLGGLIADNDVP